MQTTPQRRPHFRRVETPNFKLQPRDVEIIQQVYKHRFLRSTHLAALAGGSEQQIRRRLQLLFHNAYLDRPREQLAYQGENRRPYAYGLGNKGASPSSTSPSATVSFSTPKRTIAT